MSQKMFRKLLTRDSRVGVTGGGEGQIGQIFMAFRLEVKDRPKFILVANNWKHNFTRYV